jgi:uncharacterized membrane protein YgdD (TMEM256/DUF423 family)
VALADVETRRSGVNLDRLSLGEKVLGVSALALFLLSFLKQWVKVEAEGAGASFTAKGSAWDGYGFPLKLGLLLAILAAILVVARAANANLNIPWSNVYRGLAFATLVLVALTLLIGPDESGAFSSDFGSIEISRGIALFAGTVLAAAMAAGAWMHSEAPAAGATTDAAPA